MTQALRCCIIFLSGEFEAGAVSITFAPGSTSSMCTVAISGDDNLIEDTEEFMITLQNPSLGSVDQSAGSATVFITDNESKRFTISMVAIIAACMLVDHICALLRGHLVTRETGIQMRPLVARIQMRHLVTGIQMIW